MEEKVKNLCAPIPAGLHARVREEQEASGKTLGQYMAWLIQTFYENQVKEENIMIMDKRTVVKATASILTNEKSRKAVGWVLTAVLSPVILLLAFFCTSFSGGAEHNRTVVDLCFHGGAIPEDTPAEYQACIQEMRDSFALLDAAMQTMEGQMEDGDGLDDVRVKAVFFALYFGADDPAAHAGQTFVDCFVTYEERTRTVTTVDEEGNEVETQETYTVAVPIPDLQQVWQNLQRLTGTEVTPEQQANADSVYNVVKYGASTGTEGWIPGADVPFIGADGFCSPIGAGWESRVTSEFGYRRDPFTGETRGHTGMDLAVPTGTPVRAALPGTVTAAQYHSSYGYYVMIDHGNGLSTLYAHNSQLLVRVGQTVETGDIVSLSGSTGRSTGPHLHFEVRVNGQRTNPRHYLPGTQYNGKEANDFETNLSCGADHLCLRDCDGPPGGHAYDQRRRDLQGRGYAAAH